MEIVNLQGVSIAICVYTIWQANLSGAIMGKELEAVNREFLQRKPSKWDKMKRIIKILLYLFAAIMLIFFIVGITSRDKTKIPEGFEGKYIEISGIKIRYNQLGKGRTQS